MANNIKNEDTLLSRTLKVEEKKVPSEFSFVAYWRRYGRFKIFAIQNKKTVLVGHNFEITTKN